MLFEQHYVLRQIIRSNKQSLSINLPNNWILLRLPYHSPREETILPAGFKLNSIWRRSNAVGSGESVEESCSVTSQYKGQIP